LETKSRVIMLSVTVIYANTMWILKMILPNGAFSTCSDADDMLLN